MSEAEVSRKTDTTWWDKDLLTSNATANLNALMGEKVFNNPKNVNLILRILELFFYDDKNGFVLDFFSGSGTTSDAVMQYNVKNDKQIAYIAIQIDVELEKQLRNETKASEKKKTEKLIQYLVGLRRKPTLDSIGLERIKRVAAKLKEEHPETTADLGFKHFTLKETPKVTLDKLEDFVPDKIFLDNDILSDFGVPTVLTTWLVRDGYGFNAPVQKLAFADYHGYYMGKHLYLLDAEISKDAIAAIADKFETDASFNPENIVLFGYSFTWTALEELKVNLARLKATEKNLHLNFDVRY